MSQPIRTCSHQSAAIGRHENGFARGIAQIVDELKRLSYGDDALQKVLGGNFLRIAEQVWR